MNNLGKIIEKARRALETRRLSSWPSWQDQLLQAANSYLENGDFTQAEVALGLWRDISQQAGGYHWGRKTQREAILRLANGQLSPELIELLTHPPRRRGVFTAALSRP